MMIRKDLNCAENQRVTAYCYFYEANQRQPKNSKYVDEKERSLAIWRGHMKTADKGIGTNTPLTYEQQEIILSVDKDFFQ